jgi:pentatricopeptide repeat protein
LEHIDAEKHDDQYPWKNTGSNNREHQKVAVAALRVCGNVNDHDLALELYGKYRSEAIRATTISVLGSCNQISKVLKLLEDDFCPPSAPSFNAAIAACGRNGNWQVALDIYENKMPKQMISTLSTNALLTVLAKCRQGTRSLEILDNIVPTKNPKAGSESITYTLVISALVRSNMLTEASKILQDLDNRQHHCSPKSIEAMKDVVLSAYSQRSDWSGVDSIERIQNQNQFVEKDDELNNATNRTISNRIIESDYRYREWKGFEKLGKGKESYWVIGTYQDFESLNITVGVRPHRNPSRNGIQILFFENFFDDKTSDWKQLKIGFLLMKNSWKEQSSSLLGMFLKPTERGRGFSKVCLSVWMWLSLKASIVPVTGIIRKPLLALILQHTFGFVDSTKNSASRTGTLVELSQDPDDPNCVNVYPLSGKSLDGAFSFSNLKGQNIKLTSRRSSERGRVVKIGSRLYPPPDTTNLQGICDEILPSKLWKCNLSCEGIQLIFLGRLLLEE